MPKYRVEGTSGGSDQRVIEASGVQDAIEQYLHYPGFAGLITEYDEHSDPRGSYGKGDERWSRITISISPAFEGCTAEFCEDEAMEDGLCYDHQPEEEEDDE